MISMPERSPSAKPRRTSDQTKAKPRAPLVLKKKITIREWATLIALGTAGMAAYFLILGIVALLLGLLVATVADIRWEVAAVISYLGLRLVLELPGALRGLRSTRCTECHRKIMTNNPIKCEECGGAARLVGKNTKRTGGGRNDTGLVHARGTTHR